MWKLLPTIQFILMIVPAAVCAGQDSDAIRRIEAPSVETGIYEKLELLIRVNRRYNNPFDPEEVDMAVVLKTPGGGQMTLPAFYCQDYERRKLNQGRSRANWYYPVGNGTWKARFAPMRTGSYFATARLKDKTGTIQSESIRFDCVSSSRKGFLRVCEKDPRFMELSSLLSARTWRSSAKASMSLSPGRKRFSANSLPMEQTFFASGPAAMIGRWRLRRRKAPGTARGIAASE